MRRFQKSEKIADLLKHSISNALLFEVEEEKLRWVSITAVKVNKDAKIAETYYAVVKGKISVEEASELISKNLYKIRRYISENLRLKQLPEIKFIYDDTEEKAERIEKILEDIRRGKKDDE